MQYSGVAAALFSEKFSNPAMGGIPAFEMSFAAEGSTVVQWTDYNFNSDVRRFTSTDADVKIWTGSPAGTQLFHARFPFILPTKVGGYYYGFGIDTGSISCWKSADGISWAKINGGAPVLTVSSDPASIWFNIWNVGVTIDGGGTWHLVAECAPNGAAQNGCGLGYASATLFGDSISFDTTKTAAHVVPYGGNPWIGYVPERDALLCVHGMIYDPSPVIPNTTNYWYMTASTVPLSANPALSASWATHRDKFSVGQSGIHVCDPSVFELPAGKTSKLIFAYSYNQTQMYAAYSDSSMLQLYDAVTLSATTTTAAPVTTTAAPLPMGAGSLRLTPYQLDFSVTPGGALRIPSSQGVLGINLGGAGPVRVKTVSGVRSLQ